MRVIDKLLHPKLRAKLIIGAVVAACAAIAVQFAISAQRVEVSLAKIENERMSEDLDVVQGALDQLRLGLEQATTGASVSSGLARAVRECDQEWLDANVTERLKLAYGAQSVMVLDGESRPVAVAGLILPAITHDQMVTSALQMKVVSSEFVYANGGLWLVATAPILATDLARRATGVLVIGQRVDDVFAHKVSRLVKNHVTFFVKGRVVATTDPQLADRLAQPSAYAALESGRDLVQVGRYASRGRYLGAEGANDLVVVSNERRPIAAAESALRRSMLFALIPAVALACLVAIVLAAKILRPLRSLRGAVNAIAFGDLQQRVAADGDDEIADLGRAFNAMAERVSAAQKSLRRAAVRDGLTGLLNHREFYRRLTDEIARCERATAPLSMLMVDLDCFKRVNDTYGHTRGDAVLREVASVISRSVREADVVARYAGDEFAVILPMTPEEDAHRIAERIRLSLGGVAAAVGLPDDERITLSVGVATRWPGEHTATETVELADHALYHAKEGGRDRVVVGDDLPV